MVNEVAQVLSHNQVLVSEFMDLGNLNEWLGRMREMKDHFRNRVLWYFLDCRKYSQHSHGTLGVIQKT